MKILVTGASGQLGYDICKQLKLHGYDYLGVSSRDMEVTDPSIVKKTFDYFKPDAVIHCAAFNFVDLAEHKMQSMCRKVNVDGTKNITDSCLRHGCYLLSIGTDFVFDGKKDRHYETYDEKNPLSFYGKTKSEAEDVVLSSSEDYAVVRTAWLCGTHFTNRGNFVESMLNLGRQHSEIRVVNDQIGSPTFTFDLAKTLIEMTNKRIKGIYHATNEGFVSRADFAREILKSANIDCDVIDVKSEDYPAIAKRPKFGALSKDSLDHIKVSRLPKWQDALIRYLELRKEI